MDPLHSLVAHKGHFSLAKCVCELNSTAHSASHVHSSRTLSLSPTVPLLLTLGFTSMLHPKAHTHHWLQFTCDEICGRKEEKCNGEFF